MNLKAETSDDLGDQGKPVGRTDLLKVLEELEERVVALEIAVADLKTGSPAPGRAAGGVGSDAVSLLLLPDHLRKTMIALTELGQATASQLAEKTGRVRNLESSYLNQLERIGLVERFKEEKHLYFTAKQPEISSLHDVLERIGGEEKPDDKVAEEIARIYSLPKDAVPRWLVRK